MLFMHFSFSQILVAIRGFGVLALFGWIIYAFRLIEPKGSPTERPGSGGDSPTNLPGDTHIRSFLLANVPAEFTGISLCETLSTPPSYFLFLLPKPRLEYRFHSPSRVALGAL